ncbi:MAG: type III-B CRISPR module RAMP protein Cmr1, partial [Bacteroidales bacterium]
MKEFTVKINPLTPIWTGDENRKNTTLRETGLIGSLRWWYEALIRGLGGTACDPTKNTKCNIENHCDVCELFGCTGWSRKFRLEVEKSNNNRIHMRFIEMREIKDVEWVLLNKTLKVISDYGALGG